MKIYITYIFIALLLTSCNNDNDNNTDNLIDELPPVTTTGENTIGCLVNGEPFTDSGLMNNFYQFVNGDYFLAINWEEGFTGNVKSGQIGIMRVEIVEGETYILDKSGFLDGDYTGAGATFFSDIDTLNGQFETNIDFKGEVTFARFDTENQIMSGTFSFEAEEIFTEETVSITNGRFDLTFSN